MLCPRCGLENDDNNTYCTKCGARLDGKETPVYTNENAGQAVLSEEQVKAGKQVLLWGILSLAIPGLTVAVLGEVITLTEMTVMLFYMILLIGALLGFAMAMICKTKIRNYHQEYGMLQGAGRIGRGLSIAGMWINILLGIMSGMVVLMFNSTGMNGMTLTELLDGSGLGRLFDLPRSVPTAAPLPTGTPTPTAPPMPLPGTIDML